MAGKRSLQPGCCPCGWSLCADDKGGMSGLSCHMQMAERCLSKTWVTFSTGTWLCFELHSSHQWLLSAAARWALLIYFPSPPSVYPAGCCYEAARRCYNCCWWVNIYRVQWGWRLYGGGGGSPLSESNDIMKSRHLFPLRWKALRIPSWRRQSKLSD